MLASPLRSLTKSNHSLLELHQRELGNIREVALDQRTICILESSVVAELQLQRYAIIQTTNRNLLGVLKTFGITRLILNTIQSKRAQVLRSSVSLIDMNITSLN